MLQMEVEVDHQSSSFRTMRSYSNNMGSSKRPRSPEDSSLERPSKRLSLAIVSGDAVTISSPISALGHRNFNSPRGSGSSSRYGSEDWVRQADGLSIQSPAATRPDPFLRLEEAGGHVDDDSMNMDSDDSAFIRPHRYHPSGYPHHQRPELHPIQTQSTEYNSNMPFMQAAVMRQQNPSMTLTPPTSLTPIGPAVNVLPPTPIPPPIAYVGTALASFETQPPTRLTAPLGSGTHSPMAVSSPLAEFSSTSTPRKQRFSMGPRADCEKCRLGVKGHWVHY